MRLSFLALSAVLAPAFLLLSGCASTPPPVFSESFITSTNAAGMRLFTYEATYSVDDEPERRQRARTRSGNIRGMEPAEMMPRRMRNNVEQAVLQRIDEIVTHTAYCDKGYFIIRKDLRGGSASVFGECKSG